MKTSELLPKEEIKTKKPDMFQVVLLNDDYTPMDFVVEVLQKFFGLSASKAGSIMLEIHQKGKAVCGIFSRDIAETKATSVCEYARQHEHPLMCISEKV